MKYRQVQENIYRNTYFFLLECQNDKEIKKKLERVCPKVYEEIKDIDLIAHSGGKALMFPELGKHVIITRKRSNKINDTGVLAHECLHATMSTLNAAGVAYDTHPMAWNEAHTYLLEYLVCEGIAAKTL